MNRLRHFAFAFWLALAVVVGQQAAALHDVAHATESLSHQQDSTPDPRGCEQHFLFAGFSDAVAAGIPAAPPVVTGDTAPLFDGERGLSQPLRLAFRSRAPPAFLV